MAFAAALSGCALSTGAVVTQPASGSLAVGAPSVEGQLQLPPAYRMIAGFEWTRENDAFDLWRLGLLAGYSSLPEGRQRLGWEATGRGGLLRSWQGATTGAGAFLGARVAALVRLWSLAEPWEGDPLVETTPYLVLDLGANALSLPGHPAELELSARVLFRLHFTSTLIP